MVELPWEASLPTFPTLNLAFGRDCKVGKVGKDGTN
jgi:hypothetical protein